MEETVKEYTNGEVTIVWKPNLCIHSTICWTGLPQVFKPDEKPWIKPDNASTQKIVGQVRKCPSGALSYYMNNNVEAAAPQKETSGQVTENPVIEVMKNGPLMVEGSFLLKDANGKEIYKTGSTALCRCGASASKPFCDGSHIRIGFRG